MLKSVVLSDGSLAARGLEQLAERRIVLTLREMEPFFTAQNPGVKYAALRYAEKMGGLEYLSAVEALTADPNPATAATARSVRESLK